MNPEVEQDSVCADVAVLGGGPAGSAVALGLACDHPDLSVVVIEATRYDRFRLGESLHPGVEGLLRQLGVWDAFLAEEHLPAHGTRAFWGGPEAIDHEFLFHRTGRGWHLDRRRFDAFLAREVAGSGALVWQGARIAGAVRRMGEIWHLPVRRGGEPAELAVRAVVDATGRSAAWARRQGVARLACDRLVALFQVTSLPPQVAIDTCTLVEAVAGGWWYSARLPEDRMAVAFLTDADLLPRLAPRSFAELCARAAEEAPHTARRLPGAVPQGGLARASASSHRLDRFSGPGWLAVGDAALSFDPLSSGGIAFALRSGLLAARALGESFAGDPAGFDRYTAFLEGEFEGYLAARDDYYGRERRFAGRPFWERRHEEVTLDPGRVLHLSGQEGEAIQLRRPLPGGELALLLDHCRAPRPAHQIAQDFRRKTAGRFSDRRIVLALQDLLDQGVLVAW